ncbi:MAG TPA: hypothetical protein VGS19_36145 [Streptosporangiaceae bacterium]|nr:hypothetical protein [Streptosporangiaceae bacterium]
MFIARELLVHAECGLAQARLARIAGARGLTQVSQAAYEDGLTRLVRVGPLGDTPGVSKLVAVRVLDPVHREDTMTVALRWEATGATGSLFPVLDADISLSPAGEQSARLALSGVYRPPLGHIGAALDKAILHRVGTATIDALLRRVADTVTRPAVAAHPAGHASPWWRPLPESDTP